MNMYSRPCVVCPYDDRCDAYQWYAQCFAYRRWLHGIRYHDRLQWMMRWAEWK